MMTVRDMAGRLGVNPSTLAVRLRDKGVKPSRRRGVDGRKEYDAATFRRVKKILKDEPIGKRPGPRRGSKRSGKVKR